MNKTVATILLGCLVTLLQAPAYSQAADEHADHHSDAPASATPSPGATQVPTTQDMQANMKNMQGLMDKINTTKDPAERQKLLDQHQQAMQHQMDMMSQMMGSSMMAGHDKGASTGNMMDCQKMMSGDMSMMSAMMEQMKQHDAARKCTDLHTCFK